MEYRDPIGDILKNSGSMDDLKGKGKPLPKEYQKMGVYEQFQKTARNQGYLPEWLKLQKAVYAELETVTSKEDVDRINMMIRKYNKICPTPLQKPLVNEDDHKDQLDRWK